MAADEAQKIHYLASYDIPLNSWVSIGVSDTDRKLVVTFYKFDEIAIEDRQIAWNTVGF